MSAPVERAFVSHESEAEELFRTIAHLCCAATSEAYCEQCLEMPQERDGLCLPCWNETNGQFGVGA